MTTDDPWPKLRLNMDNPMDPRHGTIVGLDQCGRLGIDPQSERMLQTGQIVGTGLRDAEGYNIGMADIYTLEDAVRDAAPDLLAALKNFPERDKPIDEMTHDELARYATHVSYWQEELAEPAIDKTEGATMTNDDLLADLRRLDLLASYVRDGECDTVEQYAEQTERLGYEMLDIICAVIAKVEGRT